MCSKYNVPHVINNAYGVQATKTMASINDAMCRGRVDVYIQSTDKNFMVPVGGSIIASNNAETVSDISKCYPGTYGDICQILRSRAGVIITDH